MPNPIVHFEIVGSDAPALQGFCQDLFGWNVDADNQWQYGIVETDGEGGINGGIAGTQNGDANRVTVYAAVGDPQAYLDQAEHLGATTLMPVTDIGGMVIAMFRDPAGNFTGLVKDGRRLIAVPGAEKKGSPAPRGSSRTRGARSSAICRMPAFQVLSSSRHQTCGSLRSDQERMNKGIGPAWRGQSALWEIFSSGLPGPSSSD